MDGVAEVEQLRAALAARDADLTTERARRVELEEHVAKLTEAVRELLGRNSNNSNEPPSSDPPGMGARLPNKKRKGGRCGGQKGHRGTHRSLVPVEHVDTFVDLYSPECESCWKPLPKTPVALAVRLMLDSGKIAIYVRPVDFEFGFGDGHLPLSDDSVARYVLVAGVQLHVF